MHEVRGGASAEFGSMNEPSDRRRRAVRIALVAVVVLGGGVAGVVTGAWQRWAETLSLLPSADGRLLLGAVLLQIASIEAFVALQQSSVRAAGGNVEFGALRRLMLRSNAISVTLPIGGSAAATDNTVRSLSRSGVATKAAVTSSVLSGVFASAALVAVLLPAVAVSSGSAGRVAAVVGAMVGLALPITLLMAARSSNLRSRLRRVLRADSAPSGWRRGAVEAAEHLASVRVTRQVLSSGTGFALLNRVADALSCMLTIAAFSGSMPRPAWMLAYVVGLGATSLSLTPAGIGTVEVALANALVAGGVGATAAWSGAITYRLIAIGFIAGAGWLLVSADLRRDRRSRRSTSVAESEETPLRLVTPVGAII